MDDRDVVALEPDAADFAMLDVEAHMEGGSELPTGSAGDPESTTDAPGAASADAAALTPLAGESLAAEPLAAESPAAPVRAIDDPADASLLMLIDRLSSLLDRTDLTELEVQVGDTGLLLRKPEAIAPATIAVAAPAPAAAPSPAAPADAAQNGPAPADAGPPPRPSVKAPLTGIWYSSPAPGSAPFVKQGGEVNTGQVIGLIEAMKLFNEIKSDMAGRVVKVHAEDGKLVKAKQPLIEVEPL
jgi:acetyl-CoA carboxylase biotin carboxyl carrier protein